MMAQPFRLPARGRIDPSKPLSFSFNGKAIEGYAGDTVASALLANGIRLVGRSFKYHRPRGIISHGSDEPNALLSISRGVGRTDPNNRATVVEAVDGMMVGTQNHWPSLEHDFGAVNDLLSPVLVAGFYYKTFMWPRSVLAWRQAKRMPTVMFIATLTATSLSSAPARLASQPRLPPPLTANGSSLPTSSQSWVALFCTTPLPRSTVS